MFVKRSFKEEKQKSMIFMKSVLRTMPAKATVSLSHYCVGSSTACARESRVRYFNYHYLLLFHGDIFLFSSSVTFLLFTILVPVSMCVSSNANKY